MAVGGGLVGVSVGTGVNVAVCVDLGAEGPGDAVRVANRVAVAVGGSSICRL